MHHHQMLGIGLKHTSLRWQAARLAQAAAMEGSSSSARLYALAAPLHGGAARRQGPARVGIMGWGPLEARSADLVFHPPAPPAPRNLRQGQNTPCPERARKIQHALPVVALRVQDIALVL